MALAGDEVGSGEDLLWEVHATAVRAVFRPERKLSRSPCVLLREMEKGGMTSAALLGAFFVAYDSRLRDYGTLEKC